MEGQVSARRVEQGDRNTLEERGAGAITAAFNTMSEGIRKEQRGQTEEVSADRLQRMISRQQTRYWTSDWDKLRQGDS